MLEVPELLELVLLNLAMRDLLLARRVCRFWDLTMKDSIKIRRALFFEPGHATDISREAV